MVIKTAITTKRPSLPSKRPFASVYELVKQGLKTYGIYDDYGLQQYDPGYYMEKYTYKPRKRVAGYLGQTLHAKSTQVYSTNYYKYQKSSGCRDWNNKYANPEFNCESS